MGPQRRSLDSHLPPPAPSLSCHPASQGFLTLGPPHSAPTAHSDPSLTSLMTVELRSHFRPLPCSLGQSPQIPHWPHVFPGPSPQPLATIPRTDASLPSMAPEPSQPGPRPLSRCLHPSPMCAGAHALDAVPGPGQSQRQDRPPHQLLSCGTQGLACGALHTPHRPHCLACRALQAFSPWKMPLHLPGWSQGFLLLPEPPAGALL